MKFQIKDFVDLHTINVHPMKHDESGLVLITQHIGSMGFHHAIRPEQARYMAAALLMSADEAEQMGSDE